VSVGRALLDMRRPWANLLGVAEQCATTTHSPSLLGREVTCLSSSLGTPTRNANRWRAPAEIVPNERVEHRLLQLVYHLGSRLPNVAAAARVVTERLHEGGDLLGPTREREDLDLPYRWSPISLQRLGALRAASRDAQAATADTATAAGLLRRPGTPLEQQVSAVSTSASTRSNATRRSTGR
jgi:hypothetical protein